MLLPLALFEPLQWQMGALEFVMDKKWDGSLLTF